MRPTKRTKIVCTIGPASQDPEMLEKMVRAGMNVARLNFSHGTHEAHAKLIATVREVAKKTGEPVALLQDLQGPKIRVGDLPQEGVTLVKGEQAVFTTEAGAALPKITVTYDKLHEDLRAGDHILLDDGLLEVVVTEVRGRDIITTVVNGGPLTSHKGFNLPTATLTVPAITDKDKDDLRFGIQQGVDWVALSFVRSAKDIQELRGLIAQYEKELGLTPERPLRIIAKVEKHEAIRNMDEIVAAVDAIMVARGDLGIETPAENVPLVQKTLIEKCMAAAKPVIVATQMLDSMIRNPRPTRAEVSDVANAVIDHTDAVMLSGESATGKYPLEAVEAMASIIRETEASGRDDLEPHRHVASMESEAAVSEVAAVLARDVGAKLILAASISGDLARIVSRHRPELPIAVATESGRVRGQLNLSWGVMPFVIPACSSVEEIIRAAVAHLKQEDMLKAGDKIVVVAGEPVGVSGGANLAEIMEVK
ncbi:MAG TPA: pyruvate kinase [Candidatus Binatia bacterium]|nr:pyruvate kinase [Candidatus Binatia bacterium]